MYRNIILFFHGLIIALGYSTLMEKIPEYSFLFLVMMICQIIISTYYLARGFLYVEQKQKFREVDAGKTYKQYMGLE